MTSGFLSSPARASAGSPGSSFCSPKTIIETRSNVGRATPKRRRSRASMSESPLCSKWTSRVLDGQARYVLAWRRRMGERSDTHLGEPPTPQPSRKRAREPYGSSAATPICHFGKYRRQTRREIDSGDSTRWVSLRSTHPTADLRRSGKCRSALLLIAQVSSRASGPARATGRPDTSRSRPQSCARRRTSWDGKAGSTTAH